MAPEPTSATEAETRSQRWRRILAHEMFEYFFNFAFLASFLVAFAWYRRLILASYHIEYLEYLVPVIEAAILAKVIMIGDALRLGRRFRNRPLAVVTLYRTVVFSVLAAVFSLLEHIVGAMIHGKTLADGIAEITNHGLDEELAKCVVLVAAFVPFFSMKEIERVFGAEKVRGMFFRGEVDEAESS